MRMEPVDDYRAGACNIGPAEISRRRRAGRAGAVVTVVLFFLLASTGASHWWRLALFAPTAVGTASYLEAYLHFCAYFGWLGIFNFGAAGRGSAVAVFSAEARRADRVKAIQIALGSAIVGMLVAGAAYMLALTGALALTAGRGAQASRARTGPARAERRRATAAVAISESPSQGAAIVSLLATQPSRLLRSGSRIAETGPSIGPVSCLLEW